MRITEEQKLSVNKISKKYQLKLVVVFGSFVSGKNHGGSDIDIAVSGLKKISFEQQINLTNEFSQIFKKDADLTIVDNANPLLGFQISKNSLLIAGSQAEFMKFKLRAFHAFNDYAPYFQMEKDLNKKIIQSYAN